DGSSPFSNPLIEFTKDEASPPPFISPESTSALAACDSQEEPLSPFAKVDKELVAPFISSIERLEAFFIHSSLFLLKLPLKASDFMPSPKVVIRLPKSWA